MITEDRLKHILAVARLMKQKANELGLDPKEMFLLGFLHDIGYEFGEHANHAEIGGNMLNSIHYTYTNEIAFHGIVNCDFSSKELDLLNWCDMHTNGKGEYVTFEERLSDIKNRRGEDSDAYKDSEKIINSLQHLNIKFDK